MKSEDIKVGDTVVCVDGQGDVLEARKNYKVTEHDGTYVALKGIPGGCGWYHNRFKLAVKAAKPTLVDEISLKPSTRTVLAHMKKTGSITVMEALAAYGMTRIAPQVFELREAGFEVATISKKDAAGHKYTRYQLQAA